MSKKKCKEGGKDEKVKESHKFVCKSCGQGSKKEKRLCKPKEIK